MLRNRLPEIEIPDDNPFLNDKLGRSECADTFCKLVKQYADTGCVVSLNGEWGTGKTTFVKMLMQKMINEGGHPLYFNAWENDYVSDPLVAILSELKELFPDSSKFDTVVSCGGKILANIVTSTTKSFLKNKLGIDTDLVNAGIDDIGNLLKTDLEEYANQKKSFEEFRNALEDYIADNAESDYPIVFFIDELDRCNPHFSVQVLERIKHLFDIPNIVFVLSINKQQLEHAINGYYGSADIDSRNYLRRFIDIEYSLPRPNGEVFCNYLYMTYYFDEVFNNEARVRMPEFSTDKEHFQIITKALISAFGLDLRTADRIFAHTRLALSSFRAHSYIIPDVFFFLCLLRVVNPLLYNYIYEAKLSSQAILNEFENYLPMELLLKSDYSITWIQMTSTIATLMYMYSLNEDGRDGIFISSEEGAQISIQPKIIDSTKFNEALNRVANRRGLYQLKYLLHRIELHQSI